MKITGKEVGKLIAKKGADSGGLGVVENIIKGANELFANYWRLSGKTPPGKPAAGATQSPIHTFNEAREVKKAEMAGRKVITMPDNTEFRDLLAGLIKASRTLEAMGNGETPIGQVIQELPFTLSQTRDFLERLFQSKYGKG